MKFKRIPFSIHFFLIAVLLLIYDIDVAICSELQCFENRVKYMRVNIKPHSNTERERSTDSSTTTYEYLFQRVCPYAFSMNFLTKAVKFNKRQVTKLNYQKTKQSTAKFLAYSIKRYVHINWSSYLQRVLLLSLALGLKM